MKASSLTTATAVSLPLDRYRMHTSPMVSLLGYVGESAHVGKGVSDITLSPYAA